MPPDVEPRSATPAGTGHARDSVAIAFWTAVVASAGNSLANERRPLPIGTTRIRSAFERCSTCAVSAAVEPVSVENVVLPVTGVALRLSCDFQLIVPVNVAVNRPLIVAGARTPAGTTNFGSAAESAAAADPDGVISGGAVRGGAGGGAGIVPSVSVPLFTLSVPPVSAVGFPRAGQARIDREKRDR